MVKGVGGHKKQNQPLPKPNGLQGERSQASSHSASGIGSETTGTGSSSIPLGSPAARPPFRGFTPGKSGFTPGKTNPDTGATLEYATGKPFKEATGGGNAQGRLQNTNTLQPPERPPAPDLTPDENGVRWGGYKVESSAFQNGKPQMESTFKHYSGPTNHLGEPASSHIQTHDAKTGLPLKSPTPGKGEAETSISLAQSDHASSSANGNNLYPTKVVNVGKAGATRSSYRPNANMKMGGHNHLYSIGEGDGRHLYKPSRQDVEDLKANNQYQQSFHQAAITGSTSHMSKTEAAYFQNLSPEQKAAFKNKPPQIEGYIQTPAPPMRDGTFGKNPYIKYDTNGMYHIMIPKPDPNMKTPENTPPGTPTHPHVPTFNHPPVGSKGHPPGPLGPPPPGGHTYPAGRDYVRPAYGSEPQVDTPFNLP